jgi:hypothetical protein
LRERTDEFNQFYSLPIFAHEAGLIRFHLISTLSRWCGGDGTNWFHDQFLSGTIIDLATGAVNTDVVPHAQDCICMGLE